MASFPEAFLEKRISMLDRRLTLIEKFVELRFRKAFKKFYAEEEASNDEDDATTPKSKSSNVICGNDVQEVMSLFPEKARKWNSESGSEESRISEPGELISLPSNDVSDPVSSRKCRKRISKVSQQISNNDTQKKKRNQDSDLRSIKPSRYHTRRSVKANDKSKPINSDNNERETVNLPSSNGRGDNADHESENNDLMEDNIVEYAMPDYDFEAECTKDVATTSVLPITASKIASKQTDSVIKSRQTNSTSSTVPVSGESESPKRRVYAPAMCSMLPSIARNDPSRKECDLCHKHIKTELFESHLLSHVKERHLKCKDCEKTYFNQAMLRKHRMKHQPEKYGKKCRICGKIFFHADKKLKHERFCVKRAFEKKEHVDQSVIEDIKSRSPGWTLDASTTHDPLEHKECPHCGKVFKASFYYKHLKIHTEKKDWACKLCEKSYFYKHDLVRHFAAEHRSPTCDLCSKTFNDKIALRNHVLECREEQKNLKREKILLAKKEVPAKAQTQTEPQLVSLLGQSGVIDDDDPVIIAVQKFEPNRNSVQLETGGPTIISDETLVVANNVEVEMQISQFETAHHSLILVEDANTDAT